MQQRWYYDDVSLNSPAYRVEAVPQGIGLPGRRGEDLEVPHRDGKLYARKCLESRTLTLVMWVTGADPATGVKPVGVTSEEQLRVNIDYLLKLLGARGRRTLRRVMPDGSYRNAVAEPLNPVPFVSTGTTAKFVVDFELADPYFYATGLTTHTRVVDDSPEDFTATNPGTAAAKKLIITLDGPLSSPKLLNQTNGLWVQYNGVLAGGQSLVIDTGEWMATIGGVSYLAGITHEGDPIWMILEPGDNSMRVTCDEAPSGEIEIKYYAPYF
jgi:hypothetical protein